jgi:CRP-like cAMP-binding protein
LIGRDALARLPLFDHAPPRMVEALAARGVEVSFAPDAVIFLAGSKPRGWFIVLEGLVRVVRGTGARQHVIHTEGPGGTLGEVPLITGDTHPATGIAAEPTRCALFDRASLEGGIAECPAIAFLLSKRLALRVQLLVSRLDERSAKSVRTRLRVPAAASIRKRARVLLDWHDTAGTGRGAGHRPRSRRPRTPPAQERTAPRSSCSRPVQDSGSGRAESRRGGHIWNQLT